MDEVEISGRRYIKASIAAKKMGYASDYIGQLCRAGKIDGKRIGRTWYVDADSLVAHRSENVRSNRQKTIEEIDRGRIFSEGQKTNQGMRHSRHMPSHQKHILSVPITYEKDEHPLFLKTQKSPERKLTPVSVSDEESAEESTWSATMDLSEREEDIEENEAETEREVFLSGSIPVALAEDAEELETASIAELNKTEHADPESVFMERLEAKERILREPLGNERLLPAKRPVLAIVPITTVVLGLIAMVGGVFLQNVWIYDAGNKTLSERPYFEVTVSLASVSSIYSLISR